MYHGCQQVNNTESVTAENELSSRFKYKMLRLLSLLRQNSVSQAGRHT